MKQLLTPAEAAEWLGISASTLAQLRYSGEGPEFFSPSPRRVRYTEAALIEYQKAHTRRSTANRATSNPRVA